jgi:plasmid maintenance system antidote protein VapI
MTFTNEEKRAVRRYMADRNIGIVEAAKVFGVSRGRFSKIIDDSVNVSVYASTRMKILSKIAAEY